MRYSLIHRGNVMPLSHGATLIGRSVACKVVLDDSDVSRRHARLTVSELGVVIEDLDSANGVFINGERMTGKRHLSNNDRIQVGAEELQLLVDTRGDQPTRTRTGAVARAVGQPSAVLDAFWDDEDDVSDEYGHPTTAHQRVHLLTEGLQQLLARGEIDHTDAVLIKQLNALLERAEKGAPLVAEHADTATRVALKLARVSREARWVEYIVELYTAIGMAMPEPTLHELETLAHEVSALDAEVLRRHTARLRSRKRPLSPSERAAIERIERLEARIADSR